MIYQLNIAQLMNFFQWEYRFVTRIEKVKLVTTSLWTQLIKACIHHHILEIRILKWWVLQMCYTKFVSFAVLILYVRINVTRFIDFAYYRNLFYSQFTRDSLYSGHRRIRWRALAFVIIMRSNGLINLKQNIDFKARLVVVYITAE